MWVSLWVSKEGNIEERLVRDRLTNHSTLPSRKHCLQLHYFRHSIAPFFNERLSPQDTRFVCSLAYSVYAENNCTNTDRMTGSPAHVCPLWLLVTFIPGSAWGGLAFPLPPGPGMNGSPAFFFFTENRGGQNFRFSCCCCCFFLKSVLNKWN